MSPFVWNDRSTMVIVPTKIQRPGYMNHMTKLQSYTNPNHIDLGNSHYKWHGKMTMIHSPEMKHKIYWDGYPYTFTIIPMRALGGAPILQTLDPRNTMSQLFCLEVFTKKAFWALLKTQLRSVLFKKQRPAWRSFNQWLQVQEGHTFAWVWIKIDFHKICFLEYQAIICGFPHDVAWVIF